MKKSHLSSLTAAFFFAGSLVSAFGLNLVENFSTDPLATQRWSFGAGDNSHSQFTYQNSAPAFTGDSAGSLSVHLDSTLPTARIDLPLGTTLGDTRSFTITAWLSIANVVAPTDQAAQIAFGLVNHTQTGGDRSSTPDTSGNAFSTVEFNYFPNHSTFDASTPGPTLAPTVIGADNGSGQFRNFASIYGTDSDLGANTGSDITALPLNTNLQVTLNYNGATKFITLEVARIEGDGSLTILSTGVPALDLNASGYDPSHPFSVDSLAIMAYQDGFNQFSPDPSLVADVTFQKLSVTSPAPEPTATVFLLGAGLWTAGWVRKRAPQPSLE